MKIKDGLFFLKIVLISVDSIILLLGIPTYFFGFEINTLHNLVFFMIILCILIISVFIYVLGHKLIKNYFIITDKSIIFYKNNIEQYEISFHEVFSAEYFCFTFGTILNQSAFGFLKINIDNQNIIIDISKTTAKDINKKYFKIRFIK